MCRHLHPNNKTILDVACETLDPKTISQKLMLCYKVCNDPRVPPKHPTTYLTSRRSCINLLAFIHLVGMKSSAKLKLFTT